MNLSENEATDPICGMTVKTSTALQAERDGEIRYFCSEHCRHKFQSSTVDPSGEFGNESMSPLPPGE